MGGALMVAMPVQVWPRGGRYVSMSDETVNQIAKRYSLQPREIVELNVHRVEGLRAGAVLYEGTVLQLPRPHSHRSARYPGPFGRTRTRPQSVDCRGATWNASLWRSSFGTARV